ncbi:MAG: substrate-binding domain-containing protein, partial [Bacteroidota bacterium]|nr:substrate-binding domain-containing protein [Bacteroidota bacterium]
SEVIRGADQTVQQYHHHLLVSSSHNNRSEIEAALRVMRGRVDGLVIMSPHIDAETLNANLPKSLPVVLLNCYVKDSSFDSLNIDNIGGAHQMVKHLIQHRHKRIAIIKGTEQNYDAEERLNGYRAALHEAKVEASAELEFSGNFTEEAGFEAAKKILTLPSRPTAIFASNDSMAIGAISALRESGFRVPEEMAVAGFDDIPIARFMKPGLTSVHVPISNLGVRAMEHLFAAVTEKENHIRKQDIIATELVVRESCGIHETHHDD